MNVAAFQETPAGLLPPVGQVWIALLAVDWSLQFLLGRHVTTQVTMRPYVNLSERIGFIHPNSSHATFHYSSSAEWDSYNSSSSVMAPFYQSCTPFSPMSSPCLLGDDVDFAINVTSPSHIASGIAFATKNNVRLVIRNTGHEWVLINWLLMHIHDPKSG